MESLIAQDFHFTSPLDNKIYRRTYFERCWPNSEQIRSFKFIETLPTAGKVFVTYEALAIDGSRFRNTEVLTGRDGSIVEAEVYFGWSIPHPATEGGFEAA